MNNTLTSDQNFKITLTFFTKRISNIAKGHFLHIKPQLFWFNIIKL